MDTDLKEIKKIALSSNDDKTLQVFDKITSYPYGKKCWKSMQNRIVEKGI